MKDRTPPFWIFISITLPQLLLGSLMLTAFLTIKSLLDPGDLVYWTLFFGFNVLSIAGFSFYALHLIRIKRGIHWITGALAIALYLPALIFVLYHSNHYFPRSIPRWMYGENDLLMYMLTFNMPPLLLGLITMVKATLRGNDSGFKNLGAALLIPTIWYVTAYGLNKLGIYGGGRIFSFIFPVLLVISTLLFFFLLVRGCYVLYQNRSERWEKFRLVSLFLIGIVFPLLGLALNNGILDIKAPFDMLFGNFSHPLFYIIALANGIVFCIPRPESPNHQLLQYAFRVFFYSYALYFLVVFLPYLPLAIGAIIAFGLGFLMLTPLLLGVIQGQMIHEDYQLLKNHFPKNKLIALGVLAFLAIPISLSLHFYKDKYYLKTAINHIYHPNLKESPKVNTASIKRVLQHVKHHRQRSSGFGFAQHKTPYISNVYQSIVLDNLTLSDTKVKEIEHVFAGTANAPTSRAFRVSDSSRIRLDSVQVNSIYNTQEKYWTSSLDLDITNLQDRGLQEYATQFELPVGAWISEYYLMMEGRKEMGILAEKRVALWLYNQITRGSRDPGILYYLDNRNIGFRVFPFTARQKRQTGFEIIHKEPFELRLDQHTIFLGEGEKSNEVFEAQDGKAIYISSSAKGNLPKVARKAYPHFILDYSDSVGDSTKEAYTQTLLDLTKNFTISPEKAKVSPTNYRSVTKTYFGWEEAQDAMEYEGGFYPERVIQSELVKNYKEPSEYYPIFILVGERNHLRLNREKIANLDFAMPEKHIFYAYNPTSKELKSLVGNKENFDLTAVENVLAYPNAETPTAYLANDGQPSILSLEPDYSFRSIDLPENKWEQGLALESRWYSLQIHPERDASNWKALTRNSFEAQLLTPTTSFLALENEAQKQVLINKQKQTMKADSAYDLTEDVTNMSEPPLWLLVGLMMLLFGIRRRFSS